MDKLDTGFRESVLCLYVTASQGATVDCVACVENEGEWRNIQPVAIFNSLPTANKRFTLVLWIHIKSSYPVFP